MNYSGDEQDDMPQHMQERIPGVYVRESADPHELDMLWAGSKIHHREDRSSWLFFMGGLVLGIIATAAVFLLVMAKPDIKFAGDELINPPMEEVQETPTPAAKGQASSTGTKTSTSSRPIGSRTYTVQSGDTLGGIAYKQYGSSSPELVDKIRRANKIKGEMIQIGQELVVPPKNY